MNTDEIFVNRHAIAKKICKAIRYNGGQLINARFFPERPFCDDTNSYKFSSANFLRLLASNNEIIRKCDPRWVSSSVIKNNNWSLRQSAQPESLEVWTKSADGGQLCFLTEFYNAKDILDKDSFTPENQELENIINFLQTRGLLKRKSHIISFHNCISAVKKYAENNGADALTSLLTIQTWIAETKLKTKLSLFLPTFSDSVLYDIEQNPDKLFTSMNNARAILKKLYHEEIIPTIEEPLTTDDAFHDLKIIYHGSEVELKSIDDRIYRNESIITNSEAYKFLFALKAKAAKESFKTWLEFSYKDYSHGKFLLSDNIPKDESISSFLRSRLNKNRQHLLHNPQDLKQYIPTGKTIRADDLLQQIKLESTLFLSVMNDFELEENSYLSEHPELLQIS